jgi:hypothetical protein
MEMQHGQAAWTCSTGMQHGKQHGHDEAWTSTMDMQDGQTAQACSMDMQHGQEARTCSNDTQHGTRSVNMQHGYASRSIHVALTRSKDVQQKLAA